MVRKKLKAILALLVAVMFVLQAAPMYSFAEESAKDAGTVTAEQPSEQAQETANDENEVLLNYAIDENGNKVELTEDADTGADEDVAATSAPESDSLYKADAEGFFQYDEEDVTLEAENVIYSETFDGYNVGDTSIPGWVLTSVSKSGSEKTSVVKVDNSSAGNALRLQKNKNGTSNGSAASGDEGVFAIHNFDTPAQGVIAVSADVYVETPGRLGLFFYGKTDDVETAVSGDDFPYLGRGYFWDSGKSDQDPSKNTPYGISTWSDNTRTPDTGVSYSTGKWYTMRCDIDTENGTYTYSVKDENGEVITTKDKLSINKENLAASEGLVQGVGFTVMNDPKSLGDCLVKNVKLIDNNNAKQDAEDVAADRTALSLPVDLDANKVTEGFYVPISGANGSEIKWTSSDTKIATIDNATGYVSITRPDFTGAGSMAVILTANLEKGSAKSTREFNLKVLENAPATDQEKVAGDTNNLVLPSDLKQTAVENDFNMPVEGDYGSKIVYTTSNDSIVSVDNATGHVTINRPAFTGSDVQEVIITATLTFGAASETKNFSISVKELDPTSDLEKAKYDAENALIGGIDINDVRQESFYLGDKGTYSALSWSSSDENYIKIEKNKEVNEDNEVVDLGGYKAVVTRPDRNASPAIVTLTVTATLNGQTATKDFTLSITPDDAIKAYPGVEGYGAYSKGGRGGQVYHVTNLDADGEGSLTYGLEQISGARTIVFDVGGVIDLTTLGRPISIKGEKLSNVTVAGQTAPYPGITLKGYGITVGSAHDVIIRNLKIRIGDVFKTGEVNQSDPLSIGSSKQVIIDHCSLQWAIDMDFRVTGEHVTISNTIMAKSLKENSPHEKGGHSYVGMINEGATKTSFIKNYLGDSTQRTPRITDADWIDAYNNLLFNCGNGFDIYNYEWQDKNAKMNVYNNWARKGPSMSNATPYRAGRGRVYSGGAMVYFKENYGVKDKTTLQERATNASGSFHYVLDFGSENGKPGTNYDLSNVTYEEWNNNPASYDNEGKIAIAATLTYMNYPFPAPRGNVLASNKLTTYAQSDNGMGATRPARDLYDTMAMVEMQNGTSKSNKLTAEEVSPFFEELERRTGNDYSEYKTQRDWNTKEGEGPVLKGASAGAGQTKPVHWDDFTDVNKNTNPNASSTYQYTTNFEIGDWWGEFCGSPGQQTVYTLYDNKWDRYVTTTDANYDQTRYSLMGESKEYLEVKRTVADLYPADWVKNDFPEIADFMDSYREKNYAGRPDSYKIAWDGMGDGIPNWYKEYRGWSTSKYLATEINPESGYTYLEEYMSFMADDQPLEADNTPASIENFKVNKLGYSTAQIFWNTNYRTTCVVEYGTEPGVYTKSEVLTYDERTDYYHTYHAKTLIDLQPDTQYYYKVTATDENSNVTVAEYDPNDANEKNMTFRTTVAPEGAGDLLPDKPVITNKVPYLKQVRLNWTGNVATDESYEIYYDTSNHGSDYTAYAHKLTGIDARTNKQVVGHLENGKTYYFIVVAVNDNGKTASDVVSDTPSSQLLNYDFTKMSKEERDAFMKNEYMYTLGGSVTMANDPDTGEYCLQLLDETNSHGVNADNKLNVTQDDKFTYEIKMKILYQKQTDALNRQGDFSKKGDKSQITSDASDEHNTVQLNFYKDSLVNEDKDSTNSALWESAFSIFFDSESSPVSREFVVNKWQTNPPDEGSWRFDGTVENPILKFNSDEVGSYSIGKTPMASEKKNRVLPSNTGYSSKYYQFDTIAGDAVYSDIAQTGKTLHGLWYYEKGSADYVTYKVVVDFAQKNIKLYADGKLVHGYGEFTDEDIDDYNVGKIQIKSRNDGYSWVNIASIKAYNGDGTDSGNIDVKPVNPGGGGGGGNYATATPAPTEDPSVTEAPTATPAVTQNPNTNKYFNDLNDYEWAVDAINTLAEKNIVNGTADRVFSPSSNVTRAEYVSMLMRALGESVSPAEEVPFSDVVQGEWYYEPIAKALNLGVANGYEDGTFGINENISREDMMVMAYRTLNALGISIPANKPYASFSDQSSISDYAVEAIERMYCADIINGVGDNMLDPKGAADRAQSAKIIYGLLKMEGTVNE